MKNTIKISLVAALVLVLEPHHAQAGFFDFVKKAAHSVEHLAKGAARDVKRVAEGAAKGVTHTASDIFSFARKTAQDVVREAPKIVKEAAPEIEKALKTVGKGALDTGKFLVKNRGIFENIAEEALKLGAGPACAAAGPIISQAIAAATEGAGEAVAPETSMIAKEICKQVASGAEKVIAMDPAYKKFQG